MRKLYDSAAGRLCRRFFHKLYTWYDIRKDKSICGMSLADYVPSPFRQEKGACDSESTHYHYLREVFGGDCFGREDRVLDVGCGKGRVLAFFAENYPECRIDGVELNPAVAAEAQSWTGRYPRLRVIEGDAFSLDLDAYTVFLLGRPFLPETFEAFIRKIEGEMTHPLRVYAWWDAPAGDYPAKRRGWKLLRRAWYYKRGLFPAIYAPQRYSVWEYRPAISARSGRMG